ncbi:Hypothetical protein A7982_08056 [Minicystis rosea]|nr:Hypothetical protein A7982_08056 [Minicystis rosea]
MHIQRSAIWPIGILLIASGCSSALPGDPALDEAEHIAEVGQHQFPVDAYVGKVEILHGSTPFIHVILGNNALPLGSSYDSRSEYWVGSHSTSVETMTSLTMTYTTMTSPSDTLIGDYLTSEASFGAAIATPQFVSTVDWSRLGYISRASKRRLFQAVDPDDPSHHIGLLIEQTNHNELSGIVWFKTSNTSQAFATTPSSLSFTYVTDALGNPSLDPNDIEPGITWYHYAQH